MHLRPCEQLLASSAKLVQRGWASSGIFGRLRKGCPVLLTINPFVLMEVLVLRLESLFEFRELLLQLLALFVNELLVR